MPFTTAPPLTQAFRRDEAPHQHGVPDGVGDRALGQIAVGVDHLGIEHRLFVVAEGKLHFALALSLGLLAVAVAVAVAVGDCCRRERIALGGPFHEPVEGFGPIGRVGMIAPALGGDLNDPVLG